MRAKREQTCGCSVSTLGVDYCQDHSSQMFSDTVNRNFYPEVVGPKESARIHANEYPTVRLTRPLVLKTHPLAASLQGYDGFEGFFLVDIFEDIFHWIMGAIQSVINAVIYAVQHPLDALKKLLVLAVTFPFELAKFSLDFLKSFPLTRWLYNGVDYLTGGLLSTVQMTLSLPYRFLAGEPISRAELLKALLLVVQVGLIVITGGSAASIIAISASVLKQGPLGKIPGVGILLDAITVAGAILAPGELFSGLLKKGTQTMVAVAAGRLAEQSIKSVQVADTKQALADESAARKEAAQQAAAAKAASAAAAKKAAADAAAKKAADAAAAKKAAAEALAQKKAAEAKALADKKAAVALAKKKADEAYAAAHPVQVFVMAPSTISPVPMPVKSSSNPFAPAPVAASPKAPAPVTKKPTPMKYTLEIPSAPSAPAPAKPSLTTPVKAAPVTAPKPAPLPTRSPLSSKPILWP